MRYQRNIANLSWYFGYAWPNPSIKTVLTSTKLWCLSECKKINFFQKHQSRFSWDTVKIKHTCYFEFYKYLTKLIKYNSINLQKSFMFSYTKNLFHPSLLSWDIGKNWILVIFLFWVLWTRLTMPTNVNSINL